MTINLLGPDGLSIPVEKIMLLLSPLDFTLFDIIQEMIGSVDLNAKEPSKAKVVLQILNADKKRKIEIPLNHVVFGVQPKAPGLVEGLISKAYTELEWIDSSKSENKNQLPLEE